MTFSGAELVLAGVNGATCTLLLRASAAKIVNPRPSVTAIGEVFSRARPDLASGVRAAAILEAVAALALAIPVLRLPAQVSVGLLGASFLALGALGRLRGSREPCGCLGAGSSRPLGTVNMLMGLALLAVAAVNLAVRDLSHADSVAAGTALVAVCLSVGWLFWTHWRRIRIVVQALRKGVS